MIVDCAAYVDGRRMEVDPRSPAIRRWATPVDVGEPPPGTDGTDRPGGTGLDDPCADAAVDDGGFFWLGLRMPDEDELAAVCEDLCFTEVSADEILTPHTRPVLTLDGATLQLVLRTARYEDQAERIALGEMTMLVGPRSIVSIRHGRASPLAEVRASLERDPERLRLGPPAVLAAVVERVIDDYGPALDGFENDAVEVEQQVFSASGAQPTKRLYHLKREVRRMLIAIDSLQDPLNRLIRVIGDDLPAEVVADLHESADQLDRAVTRAISLSELLDAALAASLSQIGIRQNDDMRKISAWVAMAAVPTLLAGIYGMNFRTLPLLTWHLGDEVILAVMVIVVILLFRMFKRSGWL